MVIRQNTLMREGLSDYVVEVRPLVEQSLRVHLPLAHSGANARFNEALEYALFPGGKRIRPLLTMLGAELVGGDRTRVLGAAAAVEFLHNSSLIFDDLPCMDDATTRRGRPTLHRRYGEGVAILVAINLMNAAYGLVIESAVSDQDAGVLACEELIECIGPNGMLGGQAIDLAARAGTLPESSEELLEASLNRKTSALIRLSLRLGAILVGAPPERLVAFSQFAELLGNAYQLIDDMLDVEEDSPRPQAAQRAERPSAEHVEDPTVRVSALLEQAKQVVVNEFGQTRHSELLCEVAGYVGRRQPRLVSQVYAESSPISGDHRAA
jgi:geranylgeranyl diphosphate synthase, type II